MQNRVELPIFETLLTEAIRSLAVDSGVVTSPAIMGSNFLNDDTKNWATNVHRNRVVKIIRGSGVGQVAVVKSNGSKSLVIKETWAARLDSTSVYVILDTDFATEFADLRTALERTLEAATDTGTASGGSQTTIEDTSKNWEANMWRNAIAEVIIGGVHYLRLVSGNTVDTITIAALPPGVSVSAGDSYTLKQATRIADILRWGGVALTGRDISIDLANLDIALSAFRDALRGASTKDFSTLETDVESVLAQLDITLSELKAVGVETPRTLSNIYDQIAATVARNIAQVGGVAQTGANWTPLLQNLDIALSVLRDFQQNVYSQLLNADETVAQSITLDTSGRTLLDIYASATTATTFRLDVSNDNVNWISDYLTWAAVTEVRETHTNAFQVSPIQIRRRGHRAIR